MEKAILYVHGKGGNAGEACHYRDICPGYHVVGLDYRGSTPWEVKEEILREYEDLRGRYEAVRLTANSIGAYYAMNALAEEPVEKAFFISPIVDMERLIQDMMAWAGVAEAALCERREIETAFGETLSWDYLCYVREHPFHWTVPTEILYAGRDNLTSRETVTAFAERTGAGLTVMENGEHWFHTEEQMAFLDAWLRRSL